MKAKGFDITHEYNYIFTRLFIMADLQKYADHFLKEFINEAVLGVAYEAHRSLTRGTFFLDENLPEEDENKYKIVVENGLDIFGQPISGSKKNVECLCPNCNRNMAASRFAPHLEKCMGMGRNSSRIASQRIANSGKIASSVNDGLGGDDDLDDVNDADWMSACDSRKAKKRKLDRNNGIQRASKSALTKSKNSPKISSQSVALRTEHYIDQNANPSNLNSHARSNFDSSSSTKSENITQTVSRWEQHITATLSGQVRGAGNKSAVDVISNTPAKKSKKSSRHPHIKKNKKRQMASQQSVGLS